MEAKGDGVKSLAKIPSSKTHKNVKMTKIGRNEEPRYLPIPRPNRGDPGVTRVGRKWGYIDVDVSKHGHPLRTELDK